MTNLLEWLQGGGWVLGHLAIWLLCLVGLLLSCLSISGTWLVTGAAVIAAWLPGSVFPGWRTILLFVGVSAAVEVGEVAAGYWGVKRRGGSSWAGFAALIGGALGLFLGTFIPIPFFGPLIGMCVGSFTLVYLIERVRLRCGRGAAAHIAMGTIMARFVVILAKVAATLGMIAWLAIGLIQT